MNKAKFFKQLLTACHFAGYLIKSRHRHGYGIHSPFVYDLVSNVLFDRSPYPEYNFFNSIRSGLKNPDEKIMVSDIGSHSNYFNNEYRSISHLLSHSSVNRRFGELLFRLSRFYKPQIIIELGTSIGMSAICLAKGSPETKVITLEGNAPSAAFARDLFRRYTITNIELIERFFDDQLQRLARDYPPPGLVFIDGNHTYEATMRYYYHFSHQMKTGILIFDDINWSADMRKAWKKIKQDKKARITIDLFWMGIVILNNSITPGHYRVRF